MAVKKDMDRAAEIAGFTGILVQPTLQEAGRWGYSVFGLAVSRSGSTAG